MTNNNTNKHKENQKQCFSFIRFSSLRQYDGHSEERQLEIAPRVAAEKGWHLREDLAINLKAVSSYKGMNRKPLMQIVEMANAGSIPKGTVMILESIDRASRFTIDEGREIFRQILLSGVEIYNDYTKKLLTKASLNNLLDLMELLFQLDAAFRYSDLLSQRISKAWRKKRESLYDGTGSKVMVSCVKWIDKKTWKPIPEKVKVIERIFNLYNDDFGITAIVKILNQEKVPSLGYGKKGWNSGVIWILLHNRAVLGEFQPHKTHSKDGFKSYGRTKTGEAIPDYYPPIIDESLFYKVQAKFGDSKGKPKTDKIANLFSGVAFCACGARMYYSSSKDKSGSRKYFMCSDKIKGKACDAPTIPYAPLEGMFLSFIVKNVSNLYKDKKADNSKLLELRGRMADMERKIQNITDLVLGGTATKALVEAQAQLETQRDAMRDELAIAESLQVHVQPDTSKEFAEVTFKELQEDMGVRRKARDFIQSHVYMEFPIDRQSVNIGFKNHNHTKMLSDEIEGLKVKK